MNEHILIQHALKLLAECEYEKVDVTPESISDKLTISLEQAEQLLADLRAADLIEPEKIVLTVSGREYAMHVLQAHRLYETYLARTTGLPESSWHKLADAREHELSESDVRELARELGNPRFDPHGDPIPTRSGKMPEKQGDSLISYPAGWVGRVVHVEDEPPALYAQISKAGIAPDTVLKIDSINDKELQISTEGRKFTFPREVAEQISAVELSAGEQYDESVERLSSLAPGETADIISLSPLCRGLERNRMLDLGFVPGTKVSVEFMNPSGSPIAYRIRGACIALRQEQIERIRIRKAGK